MKIYERISFLLWFFVGAVIFYWSSVPGGATPSKYSFELLPTLYHIGIFFLFGSFLLLTCFSKVNFGSIFLCFLICFLFAGIDEMHQSFIFGRSCTIFDFFLDLIGIVAGIIFVGFFAKIGS